MPIAVKCPHCAVEFKTKDEYAGKRAKCPKCGEAISIPSPFHGGDTVQMPPPAKAPKPVAPIPPPAAPVSASKPKAAPMPTDDEADEPPVPAKRKRGDEADEPPATAKRKREEEFDDYVPPVSSRRKREPEGGGNDEPATPKRKRGESTDDDTPKKKRRRDDDEPKKKGKALPIILGVLGGLLLVCGGGCTAGYFLWLVPAANDLAKSTATIPPPPLGRNLPPLNTGPRPSRDPRPAPATEPGAPQPSGPKPPTGNGTAQAPVATLTTAEMVSGGAGYHLKWVTLKCQVLGPHAKDVGTLRIVASPDKIIELRSPFGAKGFDQPQDYTPLENLEVVGKVETNKNKFWTLRDTKIVRRSPATDEVIKVNTPPPKGGGFG